MITPKNGGIQFDISDTTEDIAREIMRVGAMPADTSYIGEKINLCGNPGIVTGEITRDEFLILVAEAGLSVDQFRGCPLEMKFYKVSFD